MMMDLWILNSLIVAVHKEYEVFSTFQAPICSEYVAGGHPPPEYVYQLINDVKPTQRPSELK